MKEFSFKSKLFVPTGIKNRALYIFVNVCAIILAVCGIVSIITGGIAAGVSMIVIPAIVVPALSRKRKGDTDGFYEFSMVTAHVSDNQATVEYSKGLKILVERERIQTVEYSDKLECIRLFGDYTETLNGKETKYVNKEFLLYCNVDEEDDFAKELCRSLGLYMRYVDRM